MSACVVLITDNEFPMATVSQVRNSIYDFLDIGMSSINTVYYSEDENNATDMSHGVAFPLNSKYNVPFIPFSADWADDKKAAAYKRDRHMLRCARRRNKVDDIIVIAITGNEDLQKSQRPATIIEEAARKGYKTHHVSITDHWKMEF